MALHLIARDELARLTYLESQRRSVGITPRVDDNSNVREVPPYLHIVDGEQFIDTDNSVQDTQASFRQRRTDWLRRYIRHQTELRRSPPDLGEPIGNGLFLHLPILSSLELQFAVQTFYDNTYLYQFHLQEGNEQLAIRFYRRTLEVNFFVLSYFQNADLQNQARRRIPSLYNAITLIDLRM